MEDLFRTIGESAEGIYKEKGSKFLAFAYPVTSEEEIKNILADLRGKYYDARHHCYAYRLGADKQQFRANDDGEPSSTGGKPILGQIVSNDLTNILIVVVRYFSGIKLGVSGLINAYRTAAAAAIAQAVIVEKTVERLFHIRFDYLVMNEVMRIVKDENIQVIKRDFDTECRMVLSVRWSNAVRIRERLTQITSLHIEAEV